MKQYGAIAGNPWESDSEFLAAKARAVEGRAASEEIDEGVLERSIDPNPYDTYSEFTCGLHNVPACPASGCHCMCDLFEEVSAADAEGVPVAP